MLSSLPETPCPSRSPQFQCPFPASTQVSKMRRWPLSRWTQQQTEAVGAALEKEGKKRGPETAAAPDEKIPASSDNPGPEDAAVISLQNLSSHGPVTECPFSLSGSPALLLSISVALGRRGRGRDSASPLLISICKWEITTSGNEEETAQCE